MYDDSDFWWRQFCDATDLEMVNEDNATKYWWWATLEGTNKRYWAGVAVSWDGIQTGDLSMIPSGMRHFFRYRPWLENRDGF